MDKQITTITKHSPIRNHHIPNIRYKNNNTKQIDQSVESIANYNDSPINKTTNYRYSIQK